ncbi:MAG: holo-ACP synthase [Bacteroidales bacterium]|nr:holo-ACP synthase [Bacteroidales bacterium]
MRIVGIGTQIVDCLRVRKLIDRHGEVFVGQVYTLSEQAYIRERRHSTEHYAAVWAAKEAVFRSLGTTWRRGIAWIDVEIACENAIEPEVRVSGLTAALLTQRDVAQIRLAMAHCRAYATATAIAMSG